MQSLSEGVQTSGHSEGSLEGKAWLRRGGKVRVWQGVFVEGKPTLSQAKTLCVKNRTDHG